MSCVQEYKEGLMTIRVIVFFKNGTFDPQSATISRFLAKSEYQAIEEIKQGKIFEVKIKGKNLTKRKRQEVEKLAANLLNSPLVEDFEIQWS